METQKKIILGTRGSRLALWQAFYITSLLKDKAQVETEIKVIKTKGDKILDVALAKIGDKGLFVKEIETELLAGSIDIAVHSMKDLPTEIPKGLEIMASTTREDHRDALISLKFKNLNEMPEGAVVGSSSLRRKAQILALRPDIEVKDLRGNVETRLKKLENGEYQAIIMAMAGLKRLEVTEHVKQIFNENEMISAVGQGAIAIEARSDDKRTGEILNKINDAKTLAEVSAERSLMKELQGGCQVPIGAIAQSNEKEINIQAVVASLDGTKVIKDESSGSIKDPIKIGLDVANKLRAKGAEEILEKIRQENPVLS